MKHFLNRQGLAMIRDIRDIVNLYTCNYKLLNTITCFIDELLSTVSLVTFCFFAKSGFRNGRVILTQSTTFTFLMTYL